MILSLLFGVILGAGIVVFALQNVAIITVSFLSWQFTAPLAFILLATGLGSICVTLLLLLPAFIRDEFYLRAVKRQKKEAEDELMRYKTQNQTTSTTTTTYKETVSEPDTTTTVIRS